MRESLGNYKDNKQEHFNFTQQKLRQRRETKKERKKEREKEREKNKREREREREIGKTGIRTIGRSSMDKKWIYH